jgi:hypothetical protein
MPDDLNGAMRDPERPTGFIPSRIQENYNRKKINENTGEETKQDKSLVTGSFDLDHILEMLNRIRKLLKFQCPGCSNDQLPSAF